METVKGNLSWDKLDDVLDPWLKEAVKSLEHNAMTPVQASTIPLFCGNKDVVVEAVTGSGKTLSFVIPVIQKLSKRIYHKDEDGDAPGALKPGHMFAIVLAPTRELANQIQTVFHGLLKFLPDEQAPIKTQLLIGSLSSVREDIEFFFKERPQILVGTPGRMLDFFSNQKIKTSSVEVVVLDEADKLLDFTFEKEVTTLLRLMPKQRRTGLFSATLSSASDKLFSTGITNPVKISVKSNSIQKNAPKSLNIEYMVVNPEYKLTTFLHLLREKSFKKCIAYFPTCISVKYFYMVLNKLIGKESQIVFFSLHGQLNAKSRLKTLEKFTEAEDGSKKYVLLTTDVAARGLDVPDVEEVIQLDPPTDPDFFLHRCGRTGRANNSGNALVMLNANSREIDYVDFMEVKGIHIGERTAPDVAETNRHERDLIRKFILEDRARHELAIRSYVAFVRYYSKHLATSIFRLLSLAYIPVAHMYGLLRLPKMPESRFIPNEEMPEDGWLGEPIDMDKYAYSDKQREEARLKNLEEEKIKKKNDAKKRKELKKKNEAWSTKSERKELKQERREKIRKKREAIEQKLLEESSSEDEQEDWKDMVRQNKRKKTDSKVIQHTFDDL